jgi:hypothetical protein
MHDGERDGAERPELQGRAKVGSVDIAASAQDLKASLDKAAWLAIRAFILQCQQQGVGLKRVSLQLAGEVNAATGIREGGMISLDGQSAALSAQVREILSNPKQIEEYFKDEQPRFPSTDRRFDARVRKAITDGKALDTATIEKLAKRHDARLLLDLGQTIAAHVMFTVQAQARREAYAQLLDSGKVERIDKKWNHNNRIYPRPDHLRMDGKIVGFNEPFVMDDGTELQYPHDPAGGIKHSAGCGCSLIYIPQYKRPGL